MTTFDAEYWRQHYGHGHGDGHHGEHHHEPGHEQHRYREANQPLTSLAGELLPGTALDAGCGDGGDTIWLARHGWRVTAVDVAEQAVARARHRAEADGVADRIDWRTADLTRWSPTRRFDLVTSHYVHTALPWPELLARLGSWVAPGGSLLVVGHGDGEAALDITALAGELDPGQWRVEVAEYRDTAVVGHSHGPVPSRDTVLLARRIASR